MDHLPVPRQPVRGRFVVPFQATLPFDGSDFLSYASRHKWDFQGPPGKVVVRHASIEPPLNNIGAFLQTWLLFGLPSQFLRRTLDDLNLLKDYDEFGHAIVSTRPLVDIISEWSREFVREDWTFNTDKLVAWRNQMYRCIEMARHVTLQVHTSPKYQDLGPLCLSLASVGEYLIQVVKDICFECHLPRPSGLSWRVADFSDCGDVLFGKMIEDGWCPNRLAKLDTITMVEVGKLWYVANLRQPKAEADHGSCSRSACKLDWVDESRYITKHERDNCRCSLQGPRLEQLTSILDQGTIPLITTEVKDHGSESVSVFARPRDEASQFVAISHLWADGHGNPDENALPECFLQTLSEMVKSLPGCSASFWIDTLCIPLTPIEDRKKAMVRLRESYELATSVLVLDDYLCSLEAKQMDAIEIVARVEFSKWSERLWTFQEGRLNKTVFFQFKDGPVELERVVDKFWRHSYAHIPALPSHSVIMEILSLYTASHLWHANEDLMNDYDQLPMVRHAVSSRSTSKASDEAICLASIMKLDIGRILEFSAAGDRMQTFWSLFPKLPIGLAFSEASRKLTQPGFRWAPASLMGDLDAKRWIGPYGTDDVLEATASSAGLSVELPTLMVSPVRGWEAAKDQLMNAKEDFFYNVARANPGIWLSFVDTNMTHYSCVLGQNWHQVMHCPGESDAVAIVLARMPVDLQINDDPKLDIDPQFIERGIMITYESSSLERRQAGPIPAKVFRHVQLVKTGQLYQELNVGIRQCAQTLLNQDKESQHRSNARVSEQHQQQPSPVVDPVERHVREFLLQEPRMFDLARKICLFEGFPDNDNERIIFDCVRSVRHLIRRWPFLQLDAGPKKMVWCID